MNKIERKLLNWMRPYIPRSRLMANICFVLKCRELGYGYKRILKVF